MHVCTGRSMGHSTHSSPDSILLLAFWKSDLIHMWMRLLYMDPIDPTSLHGCYMPTV